MTLEEKARALAEKLVAEYEVGQFTTEEEIDRRVHEEYESILKNPRRADVLYTDLYLSDINPDVEEDELHDIQVYYDLIAMEMHVEVDGKKCSEHYDISEVPEAWLYFDYDLLFADATDIAEKCIDEWHGAEVDG